MAKAKRAYVSHEIRSRRRCNDMTAKVFEAFHAGALLSQRPVWLDSKNVSAPSFLS
jgi:hypothetical protein